MEEAQQLCEQIIIIDQGRILREGTLDDLLGEDPGFRNLDDLFTSLTGRRLDG